MVLVKVISLLHTSTCGLFLSTTFTHFVVSHEPTLPRVFPSLPPICRGTVDDVLSWVGEGERPSIGGHPDDEFFLGGTQTNPTEKSRNFQPKR